MSSEDNKTIINVKPSLKPSHDTSDTTLWVDKDEAAIVSGRNKETINKWVRKKNLDKNKIQIKYVQGKTGKEVRIFKPSLIDYLDTFGDEASQDYSTNQGNTRVDARANDHSRKGSPQPSLNPSTESSDTMVRYVKSLEEQVEWLRGQLETVNEQRGRDQMLMLNLQNDNKQLLEQKEEIQEKEEELNQKKKGWWPFNN